LKVKIAFTLVVVTALIFGSVVGYTLSQNVPLASSNSVNPTISPTPRTIQTSTQSKSPESVQEILDDLESLGCKTVNATLANGQSSISILIYSYEDFMEVAKGEKFIFYTQSIGNYIEFYIFFPKDGSLITYVTRFKNPNPDQGTYTSFETVQITSAPVYQVPSNGWGAVTTNASWIGQGWNITMVVKNTGSADATIDNVLINGKPYNIYDCVAVRVTVGTTTTVYSQASSTAPSITIISGTTQTIEILIQKGIDDSGAITFSPGLTVDLKLHSGAGKDYPQLVTLT